MMIQAENHMDIVFLGCERSVPHEWQFVLVGRHRLMNLAAAGKVLGFKAL
jgi:hypothetical protein